MKIAVDLRMSGKSGIGAFLDNILPTLKAGAEVVQIKPGIKPFSLKEMFFFPREELKKTITTFGGVSSLFLRLS